MNYIYFKVVLVRITSCKTQPGCSHIQDIWCRWMKLDTKNDMCQ